MHEGGRRWVGSNKLIRLKKKIAGKISITSDMQITTLMAESEEELNRLLMKVKEVKKLT